MQLENYYWCFHGAIPSRICDDIVAYGKELKEQTGVTFGHDPDLVHEANANAGWNFQWDFSESCQFTKYVGSKKQHYDWHTDSGTKANENGKIRKLSMTVALVDGSEYEGGDFEINVNDPKREEVHVIKPAKLKGSVTIFPSFVWHRVTPVTSGTRYSLVNWHQGWPHT